MPETDVATQIGGAINKNGKITFGALENADQLNIVSDAAGDDKVVTVHGTKSDGEVISEAETLSGTTPQITTENFARIRKVVISGGTTRTGDVAVYSDTDENTGAITGVSTYYTDIGAGASAVDNEYLGKMLRMTSGAASGKFVECIGYDGTLKRVYHRGWNGTGPSVSDNYAVTDGMVLECAARGPDGTNDIDDNRRIFYAASASASAEKSIYEKVFCYNNNDATALTGATIDEYQSGGGYASIDVELESSLNGSDDNGSGNARTVAPSGYTFDTGASEDVSNSQNLSVSSGQGAWLKLTTAAGASPANTYYRLIVNGQTQ